MSLCECGSRRDAVASFTIECVCGTHCVLLESMVHTLIHICLLYVLEFMIILVGCCGLLSEAAATAMATAEFVLSLSPYVNDSYRSMAHTHARMLTISQIYVYIVQMAGRPMAHQKKKKKFRSEIASIKWHLEIDWFGLFDMRRLLFCRNVTI